MTNDSNNKFSPDGPLDEPLWGGEEICEEFQRELCCLADGELDDAASARALLLLESSAACRQYFEEIRMQARLHQDLADPTRVSARLAMMTGMRGFDDADLDLESELQGVEYVHKLATIFYQLGKSYILAATDPGWSERVFEAATPVEPTQNRGRGFVDGVLQNEKERAGRVDWVRARHLLNGRLEQIEEPLEKGRRLLAEALSVDPTHEEARLYQAFLHQHEGKTLKAAETYRDVFDTALDEANRGHAAMQLGRLYSREENFRKALVCFRWVTISGLASRDERFACVRFNLAGIYARMGARERSITEFRGLLDLHPDRQLEFADVFARSTSCLIPAIERQEGFVEALYERCPELFQTFDSSAA